MVFRPHFWKIYICTKNNHILNRSSIVHPWSRPIVHHKSIFDMPSQDWDVSQWQRLTWAVHHVLRSSVSAHFWWGNPLFDSQEEARYTRLEIPGKYVYLLKRKRSHTGLSRTWKGLFLLFLLHAILTQPFVVCIACWRIIWDMFVWLLLSDDLLVGECMALLPCLAYRACEILTALPLLWMQLKNETI